MWLVSFCRAIDRFKMLRRISPYVSLKEDSYYDSKFFVELRYPLDNKTYLEIGSHCVIEGSFYFETSSGHIRIGDRVHIGDSSLISINEIIIDDDATIAWDCLIYDHNSHSTIWDERKDDTEQEYKDVSSGKGFSKSKNWEVIKSAPIHICRKAWIGTGTKILKGVTVGEGAIVAAGSVVVKDVEPWTVVGGNPAQIIKNLKEQ